MKWFTSILDSFNGNDQRTLAEIAGRLRGVPLPGISRLDRVHPCELVLIYKRGSSVRYVHLKSTRSTLDRYQSVLRKKFPAIILYSYAPGEELKSPVLANGA